jgi:hypothetical protein
MSPALLAAVAIASCACVGALLRVEVATTAAVSRGFALHEAWEGFSEPGDRIAERSLQQRARLRWLLSMSPPPVDLSLDAQADWLLPDPRAQVSCPGTL